MIIRIGINFKTLILISSCLLNLVKSDSILDLIETSSTATSKADYECHLFDSTNVPRKHVLIVKSLKLDQFVRESRIWLQSLGYQVCTVNSNQIANVTVVVEAGHVVPYYGRYQADTFSRFVAGLEQRLSQSPFQTITCKLDKKAYEHVLEPKIIAYFPDTTAPGFNEFQQVAKIMAPNPQFFVVHDPQFASKFRLTQPGQISLVRRLEKSQIFYPSTEPITVESVRNWIQKNRGLILHELKDTNIYDPEIHDKSKYQLVGVADKSSPLGLYFFKILTKTIQNISRENEMKLNPNLRFDEEEDDEELVNNSANPDAKYERPQESIVPLDDIEIVWIDQSLFPSASLNLKNQYKIDPYLNVWFGLISAPAHATAMAGLGSAWFDLASLNLTRSDRRTDQENIALLRHWILAVTDRLPATEQDSVSTGESPFLMEPESVSVKKGGSFLLDCKVRPEFKCQWHRNSKPVAESKRYRLTNQQTDVNDCNLMVTDFDPNQDAGDWNCWAINLKDGKQIQSKIAQVELRSSSTKAEL